METARGGHSPPTFQSAGNGIAAEVLSRGVLDPINDAQATSDGLVYASANKTATRRREAAGSTSPFNSSASAMAPLPALLVRKEALEQQNGTTVLPGMSHKGRRLTPVVEALFQNRSATDSWVHALRPPRAPLFWWNTSCMTSVIA
ncbi:hypothetical protein KFL_000030620 [Klebsormidium nitens]|uniref:Uncharacterized protein n=1 Tax=Klebsormidium nitens TaxID=105231 RepID=A0A1Y1HMF5_KLENI|nr:hypothetical protein KFL_000030620 [Klebsormidium nitens]|eukprot:GAQ77786.1 hypothetical protein KFL_000030620 [Klebsormidium nitens]